MSRFRMCAMPFALVLLAFSFAQIAGLQGAGAVSVCGSNCFVNGTTGNDANPGTQLLPFKTIQAGVNGVTSGGTVTVAAGTYAENVTITSPVTLIGAGQGSTIVIPATSNPNCGGAGGGSLCTGASNVFLVQANNVTIEQLTVDGDNPGLTSGLTVGGADLDARNGIITNHNAGTFNGLSVHDVTVKNVYLRGMYASSGGSFNFTNDTVGNVQADPSSVAMFNFGGSGIMSGNHVSGANDAISANHSTGTQFTNNTITGSGGGVHTDNAGDSGGVADVISGNHVSACTTGGYAIFTFVPYLAPTVTNNVVSGCDVGLAALASCNLGGTNNCPGLVVPATTFTNNTVTDTAGGVGFYVTTNDFQPGDGDVRVNANHNTIMGPGTGVQVEETGTSHATATVNRNSLTSVSNTGSTTVAATCNWWGQTSGPAGGQVTGPVTTTPFLSSTNLDGTCPATVPGAPRPASAVPYGSGTAKVIWIAPANNGGSAITGYVVTPFLAGVAQPARTFNSTATSELVTGLQNGKSYRFTIAARNSVGTGTASSQTAAITVGAPGQPGKPTIVKTASGSLKATFAAPMNNGATITSYTVSCSSSNGGVTKTKTGKASPITDTGLSAGKAYTCTVTATNSRGTGPTSPASSSVTA